MEVKSGLAAVRELLGKGYLWGASIKKRKHNITQNWRWRSEPAPSINELIRNEANIYKSTLHPIPNFRSCGWRHYFVGDHQAKENN